jgi:hypothetical protein
VHSSTPTAAGRYIDAQESHVVGMVINKTGTIADVLLSGSYDSEACVKGCGLMHGPGTYYLSENSAGKCTKTPPVIMRTPVLTYIGGSSIILNITSRPPYQYDSPLIRGIVADTDSLVISADDAGIGHVDVAESIITETSLSPVALSSISGRYCTTTPVISAISGIGGITTTTNEFGEAIIELTSEKGGRHHAADYNLNGSKRVSDDIYTYIVFPKGKESRLTISTPVNVPHTMKATPWAHVISSESTDISVRSAFIPDPDKGNSINISDITWTKGSMPLDSLPDNLVLAESTSGVNVYSEGTVVTIFTVYNPNTDIRMIRAGVVVDPIPTSLADAVIDYSALYASSVAAYDIKKDSLVGIAEDGTLVNASCDDPSIPVVGIAINSATAGSVCKYTSSGYHRLDSQLKHGSTYFVGLNGTLVNTVPDIPNYAQKVGEAVNTNVIRVNIEERIE